MQKRILYVLLGWLMLFGWQKSFAQADTLCDPNENKKIFGELYFNYGSVTNAFSEFNRSTFVLGQPLASPRNMLSQNNQAGFGVYSPWYLPPQPPILLASQGDFKDRIKVSWNVNPLSTPPTGFVLYRDGSFLADLGESVREFLDFNTQAGEFYEYSIVAKNVFGSGSPSKYVGFVNPNGVVSGKVETNSGNPVPGVEVRLTPLTGNSMAFDGVNDELCVTYNDEFPTDKFTVSAYVKLGDTNNESGIIDWGSSLNKNWWITTTPSGEPKGYVFHIGNGTSSDSLKYYLPNSPANPENVNNWHQVTMVYNGSAMSVMVDGEFIGTKPASVVREKNYLNIGSKIGNDGFFKGKIDDIRVYSRPLTQTEVNNTKNRSVSKSEAGLVSYWKMDEGIGVKVFDNTTIPTNANVYGATFSSDKPEVYSAGITDVTGYYVIDGVNYSQNEGFRATPMKNFEFNSAIEFNAADKSYGNLTDYDMPDTSTVEVLFYPFDLKSRQTVLSKGNLYEAYIDNGNLFLNLNGTTTDLGTIKAKYYHLAVALDNTAGSAKIYLEGELKETVSFSGTSNWANGTPWLLATNSTDAGTGKFYTGLVDEFVIYKTALPQNVIQEHYVVGLPKDSTTALQWSYFDLNEGSDTKVYDYGSINFGSETPREGTILRAAWSNNARRKETKAHEFEPNVRVVNLNTSNTAVGSIDFKAVSTVNVSGYVRFANTFCFEDQVEVLVNGQSYFPQIITDKNGKWSADFEPGRSVKLSAVYKDHIFGPAFFELRKLQIPKAGVIFLDNTKRIITGQVAGGNCKKSIIPTGSRVVVKVATLDGCFERTDTLRSPDGKFTFRDLPARAFRVSVVEHSNSIIYNYFQNKGGYEVDLRDKQDANIDFTYFSPLIVEATKPTGIACPEFGYPVLPIGIHPTTIKVYENYDGGRCYLDSAQLLIKDQITGLPDSIVTFRGGAFQYNFLAGIPNIISPYTKKLEVRASVADGRESVLNPPLEIVSLGEKSRSGNTFTSVSPPIVLDILRDPPGDQSYAWREKGTTNCITYTTSVTKNFGNSQGAFLSAGPKFEIEANLLFAKMSKEIEVIIQSTNTWSKNKTYNNGVENQVCYTNNETITTSASEDFVGPDGDVFIGTTTNVIWGLSDELIWDKDSCKIDKNSKLAVNDGGFNSTFLYSRHYIENTLLPELKMLAESPMTSKKDSSEKMNAYKKWKEELNKEDNRKQKGFKDVSKILTMDSGTSYQEVISEEISESKAYNYAYDYNFDSENSLGVLAGGMGGTFNFGFNYNVTSEGSKTSTGTSSKSYGYYINDDDQGDAHAIGIHYAKPDLNKLKFNTNDASKLEQAINDESDNYTYSTSESVFSNIGSWVKADFKLPDSLITEQFPAPIFVLFAATSSCPYEAGRAREKVFLGSDVTQRINVPTNASAVYTLRLGNESPSEETRTYLVRLVNESNPDGAIVKINGVTIGGTPIPISVRYGESLNQTLTIEKGPVKFDYQGIKIAFYADCEYDPDAVADNDSAYFASGFYKELAFDASFIEPCSPVDISFPLQDFVVTPAAENNLSVTLNEYNKADEDLKLIRLQYRPIGGDGSWINISETPKADLGEVFTIKQWNTALLKDGPYEIRAVAECFSPTLAPGISTVVKGEVARTPPVVFGVPEPGDGTWDPGDEISITFNEPIDCDKVVQADILANNTIGLYDATTNALVDATITCAGNKIVITPNINPVFFENRTFRVVVSGKDYDDAKLAENPNHQRAAIRDKAGNMIAETIKWEFAVNQNNLEWVGTDVIETNEVLKPFSVKRQIRNRGGTIASFRMESVPSWLTVTPATGTLNPGQVADVTLTFQQDLLIGDYLDTLQMVGSRGAEPLLIDYRVRCPQPNYVVDNPAQYEGSMNMVVDLSIFGVTSTDPSDVIVAKIGGQVRGVGRVSYYRNIPADRQRWLTFLTIYGNSDDEDKPIEFAVWDGDKCNEYVEILENYTYQDGSLAGSPLEPTPVSVLNLVKKCIPLNRGFNWVSFNLDLGEGRNTVTNMLSTLKNKTGAYIKTDNSFAEYLNDYGWDASDSLIYPTKRYMVFVTERDTVCIKGSPYSPNQYPIAIKNSWNWIGYVPSTGMTVSQALRGLTPLNGDIIKSQTLFAQYVAGVGWVGNLSFLEPLKGYLLRISNAGTLTYPTNNNGRIRATEAIKEEGSDSLSYEFSQYEQTMNLIGRVNGITIDDDDELRAYIDGKLVGVNTPIIDGKNKLFFQTIYYQDEQNIQFRLYKADRGKEYDLDKKVVFKGETVAGLVEEPIIFNLVSEDQPVVTLAIEDNIIKQPDTVFPTVSIPGGIVETDATCTTYAVSTILPLGSETKPTCEATTQEGNMTAVIRIRFNERTTFVSANDVLTFVHPTTGAVLGCATFNNTNKLFYATIFGSTGSATSPVNVRYYSDAMKKSFTLKSAITYQFNTRLGNAASPYALDVSPLAVTVNFDGVVSTVMRDTSWTGDYCVNVFALNCAGYNDGQTSYCIRRLQSNDCSYSFSTPSSDSPVCKGSSLQLSANKGDSYLWAGPNGFSSTLQNPKIDSVGTAAGGVYTLTVTSYRCPITATTNVVVNSVDMMIGSNSAICQNDTLALSSGGGISYLWSGPNGFSSTLQNPKIAKAGLSAAGTYMVRITSAEGCVDSTTTQVQIKPLPIITINKNLNVCIDDTLKLMANGGTSYLWSGPNNYSSTLQNPRIPSVVDSLKGNYIVTVMQDGCMATDTVVVRVRALPSVPTVMGDTTICSGYPTQLTALADLNTTVIWSNGATGNIISLTPTVSASYTAKAITEFGCSQTSEAFSMEVKPLNAPPTITADNNIICKGGSVILTATCATATDIFKWTTPPLNTSSTGGGSSSNVRTVSEPGTYKGYCIPQEGCTSQEVAIVITQGNDCGQSFITISPSKPIVCPNSSITLTAAGCAGTLTWLGGPSNQTGTSATFSPSATTTYLVQCSTGGSASVDVRVATANVVVNNNVTTGIERVKATETIESDKKVGNPAFTPAPAVSYEAGKAIILKPGFVAEKTSTFVAEIKTCN